MAGAASVFARHDSTFDEKSCNASEEHAVVFGAELRQVRDSCRGIGFEVEAVSGILR